MKGFLDIQRFEFDYSSVKEAYSFLNKAGKKSFEAVALFAGRIDGDVAIIDNVIFPLQESLKTRYGLLYTVDGEELHRINLWLYKNNLKLIAQIHSHPTEAYHSDTDDEYPIISTLGGLSIVVPYFARYPPNYEDWSYFRLDDHITWKELNTSEIEKLIKII
jgi:hypothetical protein